MCQGLIQTSIASSNTNLISAGDLFFGGGSQNRVLLLNPKPVQFGEALIRVSLRFPCGLRREVSFRAVVLPTVLFGNPRVSRTSPFDGREVTFDIAAPGGASYILEASSDWLTWTQVAVYPNVTGNVQFREDVGAELRFYRARVIR